MQKFKEARDPRYFYQSELDKVCFQNDKILRYKAFNITTYPKYDGYQIGLTSIVYKFLIKVSIILCGIINENISNKKLAEELHKPITRKFEKRKVHSFFKDNIWGADLAHIQLISKFNSRFRFLLCVINIFSRYAWVIPLKDKECTTITNAFQKILDESNHKTTKVWVDKGTNFIINQPNHG